MTVSSKRRLVVLALVGVLTLALGAGTVTAAGDTEVSINPTNSNDGVQTYAVVVENAPDDVHGYEFTVSLANSDGAEIVSASPGVTPDAGLFNANVSDSGDAVTVSAIYLTQDRVFESNSPTIVTVDVQGATSQTELNATLLGDDKRSMIVDANAEKYTVTDLNTPSLVTNPSVELTTSGDTLATPGGEATVTFTLSNTGDKDAGTSALDVTVPERLSVANVSGDGTNSPDRFFLSGIPVAESVTVMYTFSVDPNVQLGPVTVEAVGSLTTPSGTESTATTVEVDIVESGGLPTAPGEAGFQDVLDVIEAYNTGQQYNGVSVGFQEVLSVIESYNLR